MTDAVTLEEFNSMSEAAAREQLHSCLDVPRWVDTVLVGRPYADLGALLTVAGTAAEELTDEELERALARHPRIGERAGADHDASHSEREQAGVDKADAEVTRRLAEGNRAYEERFDRVFLIRAAGRDSSEILAELTRRLGNDEETERAETVHQLREIALLRLEGMVS
jgi:2-oxo-4-hydroxy-4-carboxy-5-ureidoimidazoline decarboxylase